MATFSKVYTVRTEPSARVCHRVQSLSTSATVPGLRAGVLAAGSGLPVGSAWGVCSGLTLSVACVGSGAKVCTGSSVGTGSSSPPAMAATCSSKRSSSFFFGAHRVKAFSS